MLSSSAHPGEEPDWRPLVLIIGELATYLCRSGEARPFLVEAPIPVETVLAGHATDPGVPSRRDAQIFTRLHEHVANRNVVVVIPMHTSATYRECLVMLLVQKLGVRTIIAISDVVADTFACGQRECLVLHASVTALSVGRVEAGVTLKYAASAAGALQRLLCSPTPDDDEAGRVAAVIAAKVPVDICTGPYREALVALVGDDVYERVMEKRSGRNVGNNAHAVSSGQTTARHLGTLGRLIQRIIKGTSSLPVIIAGEALRIAPALRDFLEETVHRCMETGVLMEKSLSNSSSSSSSSDDDDDDDDDDADEASDRVSSLFSVPLLLTAGEPWLLPVLGGSLVAQLSLSELSKLRITREDALTSKGTIIHWRSVV